MRASTAGGLTIAPLRLRLLAGFIDALPGLTALVAGGLAAGEFAHMNFKRWEPLMERLRSFSERARGLNVALSGASRAETLYSRNSRSLGSRVVGIRRVDARTGGPITARQALTRVGVSGLSTVAAKVRRERAAEPELSAVREAHPDDEQAQLHGTMKVYEKYDINMFSSCGWGIAALLVMTLPVCVPPRHQTLPDLIAGTVVVVDR